MKSILIISPFRNEDHSVSHYLKALKALDYPPELIDVYWLENDSSDNTLSLLQAAKDDFNFKSLTLNSVKILGSVAKRPPGEYWKDLRYGSPRVDAWLVIWNDIFFPLIRESTQDYILMWYSDALPPPNVIHEYLKVYKKYPAKAKVRFSAGWVGGSLPRREPRPAYIKSPVESPWPIHIATMRRQEVMRCQLTGHVWMMPREVVKDCVLALNPPEIHLSIIECLAEKGFYVYYQPSVYIPHVSTDGKIHHPRVPW